MDGMHETTLAHEIRIDLLLYKKKNKDTQAQDCKSKQTVEGTNTLSALIHKSQDDWMGEAGSPLEKLSQSDVKFLYPPNNLVIPLPEKEARSTRRL